MLPAAEDGEKFFAGARIDVLFGEFSRGFDGHADLIDVELAPITLTDMQFEAALIGGCESALEIVGNQLN